MSASLAILLAAGKSSRMKSDVPKVLHPVCGRPMIHYVLDAVRAAGVEKTVVVVGHQAELVRECLAAEPDVQFAVQQEQLGTGHAVMSCREQLAGHDGQVIILAGDTPLIRAESLTGLLAELNTQNTACVIGTATTAANQGLGRIVRNAEGDFLRIVEEKDADELQKKIQEINVGCYAFDGPLLLKSLDEIRPNNQQAEYYLTDCPAVLLAQGHRVVASNCFDIQEAMGVNTRVQLAEVQQIVSRRAITQLMTDGVTFVSPDQTWIDAGTAIGRDTVIHPFCHFGVGVTIGTKCEIGPHVVIEGPVSIPDGTEVPPFTRIQPEA